MSFVSVSNLSDSSASYSKDVFYRGAAPLFPGKTDRNVGVVLLDDATFDLLGDTFPASYGTHALVLQAIRSYRPRAVFIDFAFFDERDDPTLPELIAEIGEFEAAGIPVYMPGYSREGAVPIRPEFQDLVDRGAIRMVSFELGRVVLGSRVYPVAAGSDRQQPVASRIARDIYPAEWADVPEIPEFELWWGLPPDPFNCLREGVECPSPHRWTALLGRLLAEFRLRTPWGSVPWGMVDVIEAPYSPFLFGHEVLNGDGRELFERALAEKIVF